MQGQSPKHTAATVQVKLKGLRLDISGISEEAWASAYLLFWPALSRKGIQAKAAFVREKDNKQGSTKYGSILKAQCGVGPTELTLVWMAFRTPLAPPSPT